jgi:hypothetical protein
LRVGISINKRGGIGPIEALLLPRRNVTTER